MAVVYFLVISLSFRIASSLREDLTINDRRPNIVLIVADDLGYGDLDCFGNSSIGTPHLNKLASQGVKLTHNMAADTMCTPSRAAFLTGRYPIRSGMVSSGWPRTFFFSASASGLPANETTIGEVAREAGYRTAFLGKWHQGWSVDRTDPSHPHPLNQGFEYFYGVPLTNMPEFDDLGQPILLRILPDLPLQLLVVFILVGVSVLWLARRRYVNIWLATLVVLVTGIICGSVYFIMVNMKLLNSFLYRNYDLVEQPIHLPSVTRKLVMESEEFLAARHEDNVPFLLLLSWLHVHTALATGPQFRGQSSHGPYGDAVQEMDWGVGQLMDMLERYGMVNNTFVYFTSDHGAAPGLRDNQGRVAGGSNRPFKGAKQQGSTEGSFRVPGIIRWPGKIAAGQVIDEPVSLMDVLPTVAALLDVDLRSDVTTSHTIDGTSLLPLITGQQEQETVSPHEFLFHYCQDRIHAVRYRPRTGRTVWKLMFREPDPDNRDPTRQCDGALHLDPPKLYDLTFNPTATSPLDPSQHPEVVSAIMTALSDHRDSIVTVPSQFAWTKLLWQPWNQPCCNFPACACEDIKFKGMFLD